MLTSTAIIILNYTKYSDSSIIVHGICEQYGRISFLVYGIGSKNRSKLVSFQPLYLIDAQLYYKANRGIQKLKEFRLNPPLYSLSSDIRKSSLAMFISELLAKTIREEYADANLFQFIKTSILFLDELNENLGIFHLVFLLKLSRFLGFAPHLTLTNAPYFDYKEGGSTKIKPQHQHFIVKEDAEILIKLLNSEFNLLPVNLLSKTKRNSILEAILNMYDIHILNFTSLKSYQVLKEVFE